MYLGDENDNSTVLLTEDEQDTAEYLTGYEIAFNLFWGGLSIILAVVLFIIVCCYTMPVAQ